MEKSSQGAPLSSSHAKQRGSQSHNQSQTQGSQSAKQAAGAEGRHQLHGLQTSASQSHKNSSAPTNGHYEKKKQKKTKLLSGTGPSTA